ncbi:MAG: ABC transporter permease [Oscillochloris sp.]|nr:ABC transporter permease [Oscillochloris sp.]
MSSKPLTSLASQEIEALRRRPLWQVRLLLWWRGVRAGWAIFAENRIGLVGLAIILSFAVMALIHPILINTIWPPAIYDPVNGYDPLIISHPAPPQARHWLGTDPYGRDVLSQLMYSTRAEFVLGMIAALVTVVIGTSVGAIAAYFGGLIDAFFMRLADLMITLPFTVLLIVIGGFIKLDLGGLALMIGILAGFGATTIILKSQALTVKVRTYVEAARVAGGGHVHIMLHHIVPNLLPLSFLYMMFTVTDAIASEAVLSYLGLLDARMSWGLMIFTAQTSGYLLNFETWWLIMPAGLAITLLCAAFYLVGRALDEVVNPRLRSR